MDTNNNEYRIEKNEILGRYLVAAKDIDVGEIVIVEAPLIKGPSQVTGPVCLTCLQRIDQQNSVECEKCGWPLCKNEACHVPSDHKAECDWTINKRQQKVSIKQFVIPHRTYECITALRCLYQRDTNPILWRKLLELESHDEERKNTEKYDSDKTFIAQFLNRFFKLKTDEFTENDVLKICGIIQINGHEVPLTDPPYVAIYETASMLEHSCLPNCCKIFAQDGNLLIRAIQPIKNGEHISICYTDPLWSTVNRLEHLLVTKYFFCECKRCSDATELGTYYSGITCFEKNCSGFVVPHVNVEKKCLPDPVWKCRICNITQSKSKIHNVLGKIAQDYSLTDKRNTISCEKFLKHCNNNDLLHPNHYFLTDIRLKLVQLYGQTAENDLHDLSDENLKHKILLCHQSLEFSTLLFPAEWRIRGMLEFELHVSIAEDTRRKATTNELDSDTLRLKLLESKKWLEKAIFHLKYEPEVLAEGKILEQAKQNLTDVESLLVRMYL